MADTSAEPRRWTQALLAAAALAGALAVADYQISEGRSLGNERNAVFGGLARIEESEATGVILLGSSTSADWLPTTYLASLFHKTREEVVRAHINGCHQTCTLSEVRSLLAQGRHYEVAIFGSNQFQMCEHAHSKRVLQHRILMPTADLPLLLGLYAKTSEPLTYYGRYFGGALSAAYADTTSVQRVWSQALWGEGHVPNATTWVRPKPPAAAATSICRYEPDDVRYKTAAQEALLESMAQLADRVFVLLLPEVTLSDPSPEARAAWLAHRENYQRMVAAHPQVTLVDLTLEGPRNAEDFTDGFHMQPELHRAQRRRLRDLLAEGGHITLSRRR